MTPQGHKAAAEELLRRMEAGGVTDTQFDRFEREAKLHIKLAKLPHNPSVEDSVPWGPGDVSGRIGR